MILYPTVLSFTKSRGESRSTSNVVLSTNRCHDNTRRFDASTFVWLGNAIYLDYHSGLVLKLKGAGAALFFFSLLGT